MGGLGHIIERSGIATTQISLIREHTEKVKPPRALWVPYVLGRPFGVPNDPAFQTGVLQAALALLARTDGPVLEDYPIEAPEPAAGDDWSCAVQLPVVEPVDDAESQLQGLLTELRLLHPWYDEGVRKRGRTGFGVSGRSVADVESMARDLVAASHGATVETDGYAHDMPVALKYAADDLKTFYFEAAASQPGRAPSVQELNDWFFQETRLGGDVLHRLAAELGRLGFVIIPGAYRRAESS